MFFMWLTFCSFTPCIIWVITCRQDIVFNNDKIRWVSMCVDVDVFVCGFVRAWVCGVVWCGVVWCGEGEGWREGGGLPCSCWPVSLPLTPWRVSPSRPKRSVEPITTTTPTTSSTTSTYSSTPIIPTAASVRLINQTGITR